MAAEELDADDAGQGEYPQDRNSPDEQLCSEAQGREPDRDVDLRPQEPSDQKAGESERDGTHRGTADSHAEHARERVRREAGDQQAKRRPGQDRVGLPGSAKNGRFNGYSTAEMPAPRKGNPPALSGFQSGSRPERRAAVVYCCQGRNWYT